VTIEWDQSGATGRVVAPAYDLTPILKASDLQKDPQVRARNRAANRRNLPDECFVCGRGMTADAVERGTSIHLLTDGTIDPVRDLDAAMNDPRSQGWFPVGSECAKRVPPEVRW
jgi:hypothetical protein